MDTLLIIFLIPAMIVGFVLGKLADVGYFIWHREWPMYPWGPNLGIGGAVLVGLPITLAGWIFIIYELVKHVSISLR